MSRQNEKTLKHQAKKKAKREGINYTSALHQLRAEQTHVTKPTGTCPACDSTLTSVGQETWVPSVCSGCDNEPYMTQDGWKGHDGGCDLLGCAPDGADITVEAGTCPNADCPQFRSDPAEQPTVFVLRADDEGIVSYDVFSSERDGQAACNRAAVEREGESFAHVELLIAPVVRLPRDGEDVYVLHTGLKGLWEFDVFLTQPEAVEAAYGFIAAHWGSFGHEVGPLPNDAQAAYQMWADLHEGGEIELAIYVCPVGSSEGTEEADESQDIDYNEPSVVLDLLEGRGWQVSDRQAALDEIARYLTEIASGPGWYCQRNDSDEEGRSWERGGGPWADRLETHLAERKLIG